MNEAEIVELVINEYLAEIRTIVNQEPLLACSVCLAGGDGPAATAITVQDGHAVCEDHVHG